MSDNRREDVNKSTKRVRTKKPRNAAQVAIEISSFNQLAKSFITQKRLFI